MNTYPLLKSSENSFGSRRNSPLLKKNTAKAMASKDTTITTLPACAYISFCLPASCSAAAMVKTVPNTPVTIHKTITITEDDSRRVTTSMNISTICNKKLAMHTSVVAIPKASSWKRILFKLENYGIPGFFLPVPDSLCHFINIQCPVIERMPGVIG